MFLSFNGRSLIGYSVSIGMEADKWAPAAGRSVQVIGKQVRPVDIWAQAVDRLEPVN